MFCRSCGKQSEPGDVYCRRCGAPLPQSLPEEEPLPYMESEYSGGNTKKKGVLPLLLAGAAALCLMAGAGVAAWRLEVPGKIMSLISGKAGEAAGHGEEEEENIQLTSLIELHDLEVDQKDGVYVARAEATMPDLSQCMLDLSDELDMEDMSLDEAEELLSQELVRYARSQDAPEITLDIQVDLLKEARRKVSSLDYLMENPVTEPEDYEFTDSEIEDLILQEAIRLSFAAYMEFVYENLDLDEGGIIPEYYLNTDR